MNVYDKLSDPLAFTVFVVTLLFPIGVGLWAMRRTKDQGDFFLGGRAMGKFTVALSAVSSGRSSWLVLGLSGMAWKMGLGAVWAIVGYIAVEALQFVTIGKRLRRETQRQGSITLLDYFEARFDDRSHVLRLVGALIIGVFITAYVAAQFNAGAKTLTTALEIPLWLSLLASGALILVYMVLGGFVAVAYNDVIRALIMLMGLLVLPAVAFVELGGWGDLSSILGRASPDHLSFTAIGLGAMVGFAGIGLGSPGQPHIVVRYMSIDDERNLTASAIIGTFWNVVLGLGAICIGLVGRALVPELSGLPNEDPEMIYLVLSSAHFGPVLYGLLVGGVFAAILSTADSQLLVVASTVVRDLWGQVVKAGQALDPKQELLLSRVVVVLSGLVAMVLAYVAKDLVFWLVLFAWGGLGAALGPALILSLFWERTSRLGVLAGMLTGTGVTMVWKLWLKEPTGLYELIPAFFGALLVIVVVSLLAPDRRARETN
jgi:SSS family solute:Na+ symporter